LIIISTYSGIIRLKNFFFLPLEVGSRNSGLQNDIATMNVGLKQKCLRNKNPKTQKPTKR
jgi:hypothetical protein